MDAGDPGAVYRLAFGGIALVAFAAWIVAVVSVVRIDAHVKPGPLQGPAFLHRIDTFRILFGRPLILPLVRPENLTEKGRAVRRHLVVAFLTFIACCFGGALFGIVMAMRASAG